jgi:hypothetical protein
VFRFTTSTHDGRCLNKPKVRPNNIAIQWSCFLQRDTLPSKG